MKGKKAKKMTGRELSEKLFILKHNNGSELETESAPAYQTLFKTAQRYPMANFVFLKKKIKDGPSRKLALFDICDGMIIYCRYGENMTFYVSLPKHYL